MTRAKRAIDLYGGVVLADSVGLGKTFVALAVTRDSERVVVVAPAVLRETWMESAVRADATVHFVSTESLSRAGQTHTAAGFVIVDEAHHFRNPRTRRYTRLAKLTGGTRVLLLTATPIHNREQDLSALLALFLGSAARKLTPETIADLVIRREYSDVSVVLPRLGQVRRLTIPGDESIAHAILALPPPLALRDGGEAASLIRLGLLHRWASSDAAIISGIRRRLAAGTAMREGLAAGRAPARRELRCWLAADDTVQLGFSELLIESVVPTRPAELAALDEHVAALRALLSLIRSGRDRDALRALQLNEIRSRHRTARILAFSTSAATVNALRAFLLPTGGVAAVTAQGGWIASGRTTRAEVLRMFRSPAHRREGVGLLLATDLLSEGLNLPEASVVVHLDLPWTAARLEQRVGRARRPGSGGRIVRSYAFVQPAAIERLIGKERSIRTKACAAEGTTGAPEYGDRISSIASSPVRLTETARRLLNEWSRCAPGAARRRDIQVAGVIGPRQGFLALLYSRGRGVLVAGFGQHVRSDGATHTCQVPSAEAPAATTDPAVTCEALAAACGSDTLVLPRDYLVARRAIARWLASESTRHATMAAVPLPRELSAVLRRLETALVNAPLHIRSGIAAQVSRVRNRLAGRLTRGLEITITERARAITDDRALVAELDHLLAPQHGARSADTSELIAVLLLQGTQRMASAKATSALRRS